MRYDLEKTYKYKDSVQRFSEQKKLRINFCLFTKYLLSIYSSAIVSQEGDAGIQGGSVMGQGSRSRDESGSH